MIRIDDKNDEIETQVHEYNVFVRANFYVSKREDVIPIP